MTFDIRQLDKLSYDETEPLLEDYIVAAINQFLESEIGQDYVQTHPKGGNWIGTFIEMAYLYGEHTLPKMTKADAQEVMEYTLPRKLTLLDPSTANDAIPELVAFWSFLKQEYKLRSASAIAKYLLSIQDKFRDWMFDPARGGMTKNFMLQGTQAGYDMTSQEEVAAFQTEYNQRIKADPQSMPSLVPPPMLAPMTAPPPELQDMLDQLGVDLPAVGEMVNPADLMNLILGAAREKAEALAEDEELAEPPGLGALFRSLQAEMMGGTTEGELSLSADQKALLQAQKITETEPGTILQDFQTVLDYIGSEGIPVSGKRHHIPLKRLEEINQHLSHPIEIGLKRPLQKSYSPIHGLYLLLRATGIVNIVAKGKQNQMILNSEIHQSWQQLNPTERYCTLLEAWFIRGHEEMLGENLFGPLSEGMRCLRAWPDIVENKNRSDPKYTGHEQFAYFPGLHNLALMRMFGLIEITSGKPKNGKGWQIKSVEALLWGKAIMTLLAQLLLTSVLPFASENDATRPFNELQPALQPYFPEWQKSLAVPSHSFRPNSQKTKKFKKSGRRTRQPLGEITEVHGKAPPQYPDYDE